MSTFLQSLYGDLSGWSSYPDYFNIDVYLVSQDTANLTSDLELRWFVKRPGSDYTTHLLNAAWEQVTQSGTQTGTEDFDIRNTSAGNWYHYLTTYVTIQHNPDGGRTLALDAEIDLSSTSAGIASLSGYVPLPAIPVQAEVYFKANNTWGKGKVWYKTGGTWVKAKKIYTKINGSWQQGQ